MTAKAILDIEVNTGPFQAFAEMYAKYQNALTKSPEAWDKVAKKIDVTKESFNELVDEMIAAEGKSKLMALAQDEAKRKISGISLAQEQMNQAAAKAAEIQRQKTEKTAEAWRKMTINTKAVAGNIATATLSLLKWATLSGAFTGILGAGGLFGIDRMSHDVAASRRSSMGLGLGYGEQKSFGVNFERVVDPGSYLSSVNEALHDVTKRTGLYGAGLSEGQMQGSTADVGVSLLRQLKNIADHTPNAQLGNVSAARHLDQFVSLQDLQRLKAMNPEEFNGLVGNYGRNRGSLNLADDTSRKWQDFSTQMSRAGEQIENVFVKSLVRLEPSLESLSVSFEKAVDAFMKSDAVKWGIDELGKGLDWLAKYVASDDFKQDLKDFGAGIAALAGAIRTGLELLGIVTPRGGGAIPGTASVADKGDLKAQLEGRFAEWDFQRKHRGDKWVAPEGGIPGPWRDGPMNGGAGKGEDPSMVSDITRIFAKHGIDPKYALAIARGEGGVGSKWDYHYDVNGMSGGAFQLHKAPDGGAAGDQYERETGFKINDASHREEYLEWTANYVKAHGWKAWSSRNKVGVGDWGGVGTVPETKGGQAPVVVTVHNNTGANAIVTTNQAAQ